MRVYLTRSCDRDAKRDGISDEDCEEAIRKAEKGLIDADLGGGLIKQRIARGNQGAARGSGAVVFYRTRALAVFLHIFPKSHKANLSKSELAEYLKECSRNFPKMNFSNYGPQKDGDWLKYDRNQALP
jgi:hypothetical protein